jgi:hypothetical protein
MSAGLHLGHRLSATSPLFLSSDLRLDTLRASVGLPESDVEALSVGMLLNTQTGIRVVLRIEHVFGRSPAHCDTCIDDREVSTIHAVLRFRDGCWSVADHSRNGTYLDGVRLSSQRWTPLQTGQELCFSAASANAWKLVDDSAPITSLVPDDPGEALVALQRSNLLPNPQSPELLIYQDESSRWMLESGGEACVLTDGSVVSFSGRFYKMVVSDHVDETSGSVNRGDANAIKLCFRVSPDEEHTSLRVMHWLNSFDLGERSHHYSLLTLARRRVAHAMAGVDLCEQGWIRSSELAKRLRVEVQHLNIQVFRVRSQLMTLLPDVPGLASIIERRRGELRFGAFAVDIVRGEEQEVAYSPEPRTRSATREHDRSTRGANEPAC